MRPEKTLPQYQVVIAFDRYTVGQVIQPTGMWRDRLLRLGFIAPYTRPCVLLDKPEDPVRLTIRTQYGKRRPRE